MCRILVLLLLLETGLIIVAGQQSQDLEQSVTAPYLETSLSTVQASHKHSATTPLLFSSTYHGDISSRESTNRLSVTELTNSNVNLYASLFSYPQANTDDINNATRVLSPASNSAFIKVNASNELSSSFTTSILPISTVDVTMRPITERLDSHYTSFELSMMRDVNTNILQSSEHVNTQQLLFASSILPSPAANVPFTAMLLESHSVLWSTSSLESELDAEDRFSATSVIINVSSESALSGDTTSSIDSSYSEHIFTSPEGRTWALSFDSITRSLSDFGTISLYTQAGVSKSLYLSEILETSSETGIESVFYESTVDDIINTFGVSLESTSIIDSIYVSSMSLSMDITLPVTATPSVGLLQTDFTELFSINESLNIMVTDSIKPLVSTLPEESSRSTGQWGLISSMEMLSAISSSEPRYLPLSLSSSDVYESSVFELSVTDSIQRSMFPDHATSSPSSEISTGFSRQIIASTSVIIQSAASPAESPSLYIQSEREDTSDVIADISPSSTSIALLSTDIEWSASLSSVDTLVTSTVSIVPEGVTPDITEPTLDPRETLKDAWIVTVIKVPRTVNIGGASFLQGIEASLVAAYSDAFLRKQQVLDGTYVALKRRRKRYAQKNDLKLEVIETSRVLGSNEVNVVYYMQNDAGVVPAQKAIDALSLFTDQELAIKLGYVVQMKAKPYVAVPITEESRLWIIGAVLGSVAAVVIIVWVSLCCYFRWCRYISFNLPSHEHPVSVEPKLTSITPQQHKVSPFSETSEMERGLKKGVPSPRVFKAVLHSDTYTLNGSARHAVVNDNDDVYAVVKRPKKRTVPVPASRYRHATDVSMDTGTEATESQTESEADPRTQDRQGDTRFKYHPIEARAHPLLRLPAPVQRQEPQIYATQMKPELERNAELERQHNKQRLRLMKKEPSKAFVLMGHKRREEPPGHRVSDDDAVLSASALSPDQSTQNGLPPIRPNLPTGYVNAAYSGSDTDQSQASLERARGRMHQLLNNAFPLTEPRNHVSRKRPSSGVHESLSSSSQSSIATKKRNGSNVPNRVPKQRKSKRIPDIPHTPLLIDRSEKLQEISQSQLSPYTVGDVTSKMIDRGTEQVIDPEKAVRKGHQGSTDRFRHPASSTPRYQPSVTHTPPSASNTPHQVSPRHNTAARHAWPADQTGASHARQSQYVVQNGIDQSGYPPQQKHAWSDDAERVDNESSVSNISRLRIPGEPITGSVSGISIQSEPRYQNDNHDTSRMNDSGSSWLYLSGIETGRSPIPSTSIPNSVEMREFGSRGHNREVPEAVNLRPRKTQEDLHNVDEIDLINESLQPGVSPQPLIQAIRAELEKARLASARDRTVTSV